MSYVNESCGGDSKSVFRVVVALVRCLTSQRTVLLFYLIFSDYENKFNAHVKERQRKTLNMDPQLNNNKCQRVPEYLYGTHSSQE